MEQGYHVYSFTVQINCIYKDQAASANRNLLALGGMKRQDFPDTLIGASCAVFEEDLERYLRDQVPAEFERIRDQCAAQCGFDRPAKSLKNPEVMALFLKEAKGAGFTFPALRAIVETVSLIAEASG